MYTGRGFEVSELGDIDIFLHKGLYHLFHLVLPNHDYIAHAVSNDGFLWRRVRNALFIGEPGDWDDDMIWTMSVSADPDWEGSFRMFYTGLSRKEGGRIQRIGLARSHDLYHWEKVQNEYYPLSIRHPYYEESVDEGRHWVSCRDPFFFQQGDQRLLLVNARTSDGPLVRRGCIGLAREVERDAFVWGKPLYYPRMYDDIEVPGLFYFRNRYYLIGNIKEDVKIHYWHSNYLLGPYESYASNVLLPKGNYAARVTRETGDQHTELRGDAGESVKEDDEQLLLWNFFYNRDEAQRTTILPPPTELCATAEGELYLTSYRGFNKKVLESYSAEALYPLTHMLKNPTATSEQTNSSAVLSNTSGYEIFLLQKKASDFRLRYTVALEGVGKTGIVFRSDTEANAHYISLDLLHGYAQGRVWGQNHGGSIENSFTYIIVQDNKFDAPDKKYCHIELIAFGGYIELSINKRLVLRYVDTHYIEQEEIGFYVESAEIAITAITLETLDGPLEEDYQIV